MKKFVTVKEYCSFFDIEVSIAEIIIISNMMRVEADTLGAPVKSSDGAPAFDPKMLRVYFAPYWEGR